MKKLISIFLCLAILLCASCQGNAPKKPDTMEKGKLKVGMDLDSEPMSYLSEETDKPAGFDVELAQAIAGGLGLELEIVDTSEENLLKSLDADLYDCVISSVGLAGWNKSHYSYTRSYADLAPVKGYLKKEAVYTKLSIFTKRGNSLSQNLDEELGKLLRDGTVKKISQTYFDQDISAKAEERR